MLMKNTNYNLPFIFSNYYGKRNLLIKRKKQNLLDKFNSINDTNYFSGNNKNINKTNEINFFSRNLFKIYNIKNFKKSFEPKKNTQILDDNEDILTKILYHLDNKNKSIKQKKKIFKSKFSDFILHKSQSSRNFKKDSIFLKSPKKKISYSIFCLSPKLSSIINRVNLQNKELDEFESEIKRNFYNKNIKYEKPIINLKKKFSMPNLNFLDLNTEKLIHKYKQKFKKEKSFFKILKERVNSFDNEKKINKLSFSKNDLI